MQFLAPLFLTALAAIGVPIVLHLIHREKREAKPFPSLMFLQRIPHRATRRRRIRDLPLLVLRILALVLLAAAFARPLLERRGAAAATGGAREVVLLLDRSYSMGYGDRWAQATDAALAEVGRLRPADRMTVVAFDAGAAALNAATGDAARLRAVIRELKPGSAATRFDPALRLAADIVNASRLPRREVVMVSDLQRAGAADGIEARLPAGTAFRAIPLPAVKAANLAVAGVTFRRAPFGGEERVTATARIVNPGDAPVANAPVTLELEGRPTHTARVTVGAHSAASVELPPFTLARPVRGTVALAADGLAADDSLRFVLEPGQAIRVLVVDGRPGSSLFLTRALAAGGEPAFAVTVRRSLEAADLKDRDVVVLNGAPPPSGANLRQLDAFVKNGGGLVVATPSEGEVGVGSLLPGRPAAVRDRTAGGGAALAAIDLTHPIFEIFRAPRSGDLTAPRFYRYRAIEARQPADSTTAVLARFDDGAIALAERREGRGHVLLWATSLDREWTDLPVHPLFVPFTHRLLEYASAYAAPRPSRAVGEVVDAAELAGTDAAVPLVAVAPDGARLDLEVGHHSLALEQRGFYTIRRRTGGDAVLATVASNVDVKESEQAAWSPEDFAAMVRTPGPAAPTAAPSTLSPQDRERRQRLWWYLLVGAVVMLGTETLLSNRRARAVAIGREGA